MDRPRRPCPLGSGFAPDRSLLFSQETPDDLGRPIDISGFRELLSNMAKETVICTYRVRADAEEEFRVLLAQHWTTLSGLGFVTDEQPVVLRDVAASTYVEIFSWIDGGFGRAHEHPDVLTLWEQMDPLLEDRDGRPKWEFPHYVRQQL